MNQQAIQYQNRLSALAEAQTFSLTEEGLSDNNALWTFDKINRVQLKYTPSRYQSGIYQCEVSSIHGQMKISNRNYVGPANFEFHNQDYVNFVEQLHQKLAHQEGIEFKTGYSSFRFYVELLFMLLLVPLVIYLSLAFDRLTIGLIVFVLLALRLVPYFKKNRPQNYQPSEIPKYLIPKV